MLGIIYSIVAGACMSFQGVFNTKVTEKIGIWETNAIVQGTALIVTLGALLFASSGQFRAIKEVNKLYLTGGILGAIIIFTVVKGISHLGPTYSISTILVAQLTIAALIDAFGWFGVEQIKFGTNKFVGVAIMIVGIVIFKWKG